MAVAVQEKYKLHEQCDRRITRSQKAMRDAFIVLVEECGLDGFTVNDLCEKADLNRGTFYNHYRSKEHLLATLEDEVMDRISDIQAEVRMIGLVDLAMYRLSNKPPSFLIGLFDYLREESDFLHAVLSPNGDARFGPRLRDSICTEMITSILHEHYRENPTPFVNYYVAFYTSAYLGVIQRWLETGMREDSETMARIMMRLLFIQPGESIEL